MKIKCYVSRQQGASVSEEIRLFKLDTESDTPYDDLLSKLNKCYDKNSRGSFTLSWKDEEGDDIVVSSNGELQAALEDCPGAPNSTLKMNVVTSVSSEKEEVDIETLQFCDEEDDGIQLLENDGSENDLSNLGDQGRTAPVTTKLLAESTVPLLPPPLLPPPLSPLSPLSPTESTVPLLPPPLLPPPISPLSPNSDMSGEFIDSVDLIAPPRGAGRTPLSLTMLLSWFNCVGDHGI